MTILLIDGCLPPALCVKPPTLAVSLTRSEIVEHRSENANEETVIQRQTFRSYIWKYTSLCHVLYSILLNDMCVWRQLLDG